AVRLGDAGTIGGQLDACTDLFESLLRRVHVAAAVVEDDDGWTRHCYRAPFVEGIPLTRTSGASACRIARANALNSASAMWWGSRPPSTEMCTVRPALNAIASKTCRTMDPVKWPPMRWCSNPVGSPECTRY